MFRKSLWRDYKLWVNYFCLVEILRSMTDPDWLSILLLWFFFVCVCYISSRNCRWKWRMCKWNLKLKSMTNSDWSFRFFICWFFLLLLLFLEFILLGNCMHRRRMELYRILPLVLSRNDFRFRRTSRVSNPVLTDFVWLIP